MRTVVWFSAGVTSAVAAKIAVDSFENVEVVLIDTGSEHDDNSRFTDDVSQWLNMPIKIIKSEKYQDTFDVYNRTGYLVGPYGARCSLELKKRVRQQYENLATDLQIFGYHYGEIDRYGQFQANNPLTKSTAPLIEAQLTKTDCRQILARAGIQEPITYQLGFKNANCLKRGCVKGGAGYWNHIRRMMPDVFNGMAKIERELDVAINKKYINGERVRVFLDELPPSMGRYDSEPAFQCGLFCGLPQRRLRELDV